VTGGCDEHAGWRGYRWRSVKTAAIDRSCRGGPCHTGVGSSADSGCQLLLLIRGQSHARRRHADLDGASAADINSERLIPLIEVWGVGHNHLKREGARACRLARERPCGWVQSDPRRKSAGFHRERVREVSTPHCQHVVENLIDRARGNISVEN